MTLFETIWHDKYDGFSEKQSNYPCHVNPSRRYSKGEEETLENVEEKVPLQDIWY